MAFPTKGGEMWCVCVCVNVQAEKGIGQGMWGASCPPPPELKDSPIRESELISRIEAVATTAPSMDWTLSITMGVF